jgi:hypothetical protein
MHYPILDWFAFNWLGSAMRTIRWLYPAAQILHFVGLCFLIGAVLLADLRLLGFLPKLPVRVALSTVPIAIAGFAVNAITGLAFFTSDPYRFWFDGAFRVKLAAIALAGLNALWFTLFVERRVLAQPQGAAMSLTARVCAAMSLALWCAVIVAGRLLPVYQP